MSQKTYRIGEAAAKLNLKSYVLRFWETEFPQIAPIRTEKGQRLYRESDLAVLGRIRYLLHERGLTIDGARRLLQEEAAKGTLYSAGDILAPDSLGPDSLGPDSLEDADIADEDAEDIPEGAAGPSPGVGSGQVQASLFPTAGGSKNTIAEDDLRAIMAELAAIHHILVTDISGDLP